MQQFCGAVDASGGVRRNICKLATVTVVSRAFSGLSLFSFTWVVSSLCVLLGSALFDTVVRDVISISTGAVGRAEEFASLSLRPVTIAIVKGALLGALGSPCVVWQETVLPALVGSGAYLLVTKRLARHCKGRVNSLVARATIDDWGRAATFLTVSRLVSHGGRVSASWAGETVRTMIGLAMYNIAAV